MDLFTKLQQRVTDLENIKPVQAHEISSLKKRVKRLEKKRRSGTYGLKRLYKLMKLQRIKGGLMIKMFDTKVLYDEENVVEKAVIVKEVDAAQDQVSAATTTTAKDLTVDDITLAKALEALKTLKPKIRGIVVRDHKEPSKSTTTPTSIADSTRPKAKGIVMEEPSEATTITIPLPSKVQEKCKGIMNMDGWKPRALKNKYFAEIKELFDKAMTKDELEQESAKKQKVDDDQEAAKLNRCLEIVPNDKDDVTIDATPLSSKSPTIIDYKIHKEGRKSYFQIIKADGSSQMYYTFSKMLKNFNKEDLEIL
nr:hypothetical protein [Tanacetum cinerariifolium]